MASVNFRSTHIATHILSIPFVTSENNDSWQDELSTIQKTAFLSIPGSLRGRNAIAIIVSVQKRDHRVKEKLIPSMTNEIETLSFLVENRTVLNSMCVRKVRLSLKLYSHGMREYHPHLRITDITQSKYTLKIWGEEENCWNNWWNNVLEMWSLKVRETEKKKRSINVLKDEAVKTKRMHSMWSSPSLMLMLRVEAKALSTSKTPDPSSYNFLEAYVQ